jgi:subtilisin family serine protease
MAKPRMRNCSDNGKHADVNYHGTYCQHAIMSAGEPSALPNAGVSENGRVSVDWNPTKSAGDDPVYDHCPLCDTPRRVIGSVVEECRACGDASYDWITGNYAA